MTIGLISLAVLAGLVVLLGLLFRHCIRATSRFLWAPDADEEWAARVAAEAASPRPVKSMVARTQAAAVSLNGTN